MRRVPFPAFAPLAQHAGKSRAVNCAFNFEFCDEVQQRLPDAVYAATEIGQIVVRHAFTSIFDCDVRIFTQCKRVAQFQTADFFGAMRNGCLPMSRRAWKKVIPTSLLDAMRLTKDFARERRNLSVERVADLMGVTPDVLYKWLATGRMPAPLLLVYENVCGINFVSRYLAASSGNLVIPVPTGRAVAPIDVQELQTLLNTAVGAILDFAAGGREADDTLAAIHGAMCALAWHHGNVDRASQPDLEF